jgi:hypothetical protein
MSAESTTDWVSTPLDTEAVDPYAIVEITVEFDEGEEVLTPKINERFGSYDLNEAARYIFFTSNPPHLPALRGRPEGMLRARGWGGVLLPGRRAQGGDIA